MAKQLQQPAQQVLLPAEGYARLPQVLATFPVSKSAWWDGIRTGRFPKPVRLGARTVAWRVEDIRLLIKSAGSRDIGVQL
ncbi:MAG: AlpA family phage regulatory protein [Candidatus Accumulibacter sp.]|nr:AlpA family phage regulatory protein [Accumulibacter sp.]